MENFIIWLPAVELILSASTHPRMLSDPSCLLDRRSASEGIGYFTQICSYIFCQVNGTETGVSFKEKPLGVESADDATFKDELLPLTR